MCLAQGPQRSDAGEARTRSLSVLSQALYTTEPLPSHKMLVRTANMVDPDQTDLGLPCLSRPFWLATSV